ncbi:helicase C-terminal domain-containing protein [Pantoea ananatis]
MATSFWEGWTYVAMRCRWSSSTSCRLPHRRIRLLKPAWKTAVCGEAIPSGDVQLPDAVITLKQGVGRLIRDTDDRGVLVNLRPASRYPGLMALFLNSLPPTPRRDIAQAIAFIRQQPDA